MANDMEYAAQRRLIDVSDEHIKEILTPVPYYPDEIWKFTAMTKRFPAVDAVEVVRCKDCKWAEYGKDYAQYCNHWKSGLYADIKDDDFCSYGERRCKE